MKEEVDLYGKRFICSRYYFNSYNNWYSFLTNVIAGPTNAKCSKLGCDNDRVSGSDYCYLHKSSGSKNYTYGSSIYGKSSYSTKSTNSKSNYTKSNSGSSSNSYSSNSYKNNNSSYSYTKKITQQRKILSILMMKDIMMHIMIIIMTMIDMTEILVMPEE